MFRRKIYLSISIIILVKHIAVFSTMLAIFKHNNRLTEAILPTYSVLSILIQLSYTLSSISMPTISAFGFIPVIAGLHILLSLGILISELIVYRWGTWWMLYPCTILATYLVFGIIALVRKGDINWEYDGMLDPIEEYKPNHINNIIHTQGQESQLSYQYIQKEAQKINDINPAFKLGIGLYPMDDLRDIDLTHTRTDNII